MSDRELIKKAEENARAYFQKYSKAIEVAKHSQNFAAGKRRYEMPGNNGTRPSMIVNDVPRYISKHKALLKKNKPAIKVTPVDYDNDPKLARIFQGGINNIMNASQGESIIDTAFDDCLNSGIGAYRVVTDWEAENSMNKVIRLKYIENQFAVFRDTTCVENDYSDAEWGGYLYKITKEEFERLYPGYTCKSFAVTENVDSREKDDVVLCYYYWCEYTKDTLLQYTTDGIKVEQKFKSELPDYFYKELQENKYIIQDREVQRKRWKWAILSRYDAVASGDWDGKYLPIIMMLGPRHKTTDNVFYASAHLWSIDSKEAFEWSLNNAIEDLARHKKAGYMGMEGQFTDEEGNDLGWENPEPTGTVTFSPVEMPDGSGWYTTPPIKQSNAELPAASMEIARMFNDTTRDTMGLPETAMGLEGNEASGKAILARSDEGEETSDDFRDSYGTSELYLGKVLFDLYPKVYDNARIERILGEDGRREAIKINEPFYDESTGEMVEYDIKNAQYDVYLDTGPSFKTMRKETLGTLQAILPHMGDIEQKIINPHLFKTLDIREAEEIANMLQKLIPPGLTDDDNDINAIKQQLTQVTQENEALKADNEEMSRLMATDMHKERMRQDGQTERTELQVRAKHLDNVMKSRNDLREQGLGHRYNMEEIALKSALDMQSKQISDLTNVVEKISVALQRVPGNAEQSPMYIEQSPQ